MFNLIENNCDCVANEYVCEQCRREVCEALADELDAQPDCVHIDEQNDGSDNWTQYNDDSADDCQYDSDNELGPADDSAYDNHYN
jgi:hypothetical protein